MTWYESIATTNDDDNNHNNASSPFTFPPPRRLPPVETYLPSSYFGVPHVQVMGNDENSIARRQAPRISILAGATPAPTPSPAYPLFHDVNVTGNNDSLFGAAPAPAPSPYPVFHNHVTANDSDARNHDGLREQGSSTRNNHNPNFLAASAQRRRQDPSTSHPNPLHLSREAASLLASLQRQEGGATMQRPLDLQQQQAMSWASQRNHSNPSDAPRDDENNETGVNDDSSSTRRKRSHEEIIVSQDTDPANGNNQEEETIQEPVEEERKPAAAAAAKPKTKSVLETLTCPITLELPLDPVMAEDGIIYERSAIEEHLQRSDKSPMKNIPMGNKLIESHQVKSMIESLVEHASEQEQGLVNSYKERLDQKKAIDNLVAQAQAGNVPVMLQVAENYYEGKNGFDLNKKRGFHWYSKAADEGHAVGMANAGIHMLERSMGRVRTEMTGLSLVSNAAHKHGSDQACIFLGLALADGNSVLERNVKRAIKLLQLGVSGDCQYLHASEESIQRARRRLSELLAPPLAASATGGARRQLRIATRENIFSMFPAGDIRATRF